MVCVCVYGKRGVYTVKMTLISGVHRVGAKIWRACSHLLISHPHTVQNDSHTHTHKSCMFVFFPTSVRVCACAHVHVCGRFKASPLKRNKRDMSIKEEKNPQTRGKMWGFWPRERWKKNLQKETGDSGCLRAIRERLGLCAPL